MPGGFEHCEVIASFTSRENPDASLTRSQEPHSKRNRESARRRARFPDNVFEDDDRRGAREGCPVRPTDGNPSMGRRDAKRSAAGVIDAALSGRETTPNHRSRRRVIDRA